MRIIALYTTLIILLANCSRPATIMAPADQNRFKNSEFTLRYRSMRSPSYSIKIRGNNKAILKIKEGAQKSTYRANLSNSHIQELFNTIECMGIVNIHTPLPANVKSLYGRSYLVKHRKRRNKVYLPESDVSFHRLDVMLSGIIYESAWKKADLINLIKKEDAHISGNIDLNDRN